MAFEYLTVLCSERPQKLTFAFSDNSKAPTGNFQEFLNSLGIKGWELIATMSLDFQILDDKTRETVWRLIFKRQKE